MKTIKITKKNQKEVIGLAVETLKSGGIIVYPTETCYGIGVDPTNQDAVDRVLKYKKKREGKAISIAVSGKKMAEKYVEINEIAENIYDNYLPGPITVVSKGKSNVADKVQADDGTLGIRIPKYPLILDIIEEFGKPITSTSANVAYKKSPYSIQDILENTSKKQQSLIDLIIDAGELPRNKPSTVINTTLNDVEILREGDVTLKSHETFISNSESETRDLGGKLIKNNKNLGKKPIVFALQGELGAGKTQFTKGLAKELGIKETILSPTFIIVREHDFKVGQNLRMFHIDAYRLFDENEFVEIGWKDMLKKPNVIVIEWAEKVSKTLRKSKNNIDLVWVKFEYQGENKRKIEYSSDVL